ncbi:phage tail tip lysozyme [Sphingomonas sp. CCH10-B3]|uniref:phage tail tip lysozyme n=1 Tax=Sphingomonas sp. CCH10-B3 TaxID=1768757 RepID=UPI00082B1ABC|nr:phage tail tip lysozyme [Sphingomonas sp. CCH10-B3]
MSDNAQVGVDIVGHDKTGKAISSAQKRASELQNKNARANAKAARDQQRTIGQSTRGVVRAFADVERAGARAFGNRSVLSGAAGRLGGISEAAAGLGSGLGEAAAAGGVLQGAIAGVGVAVGATIGLIAAAAYGAFKLADGWAKGAASIGRTAETIGVGTKAMQEFSAAAERAGVDRDKATGSLGGLSQTLNDARYGRNNAAIAMLSRLGVALKTNADGTVNVEAMLPAIADALARQNSSGRRTAAQALGISLDALPAFTQGGKALASDMADAATNAPVLSDEDIALGKKLRRRHVIVGQKVERETLSAAGRAAAQVTDSVETAAINQFSGAIRDDFKPSAQTNRRAADKMERAAGQIDRAINRAAGGAGRLSASQVAAKARQGMPLRKKLIAAGFSPDDATALASNSVLESNANYRQRERGGGSGFGLFQWTNKKRKQDFQRLFGKSIYDSTEDEQIRFLQWELANTEKAGWRKAHANGSDAASVAAGFARHVERPLNADRDAAERAAVASAMDAGAVTHKHEIKIYDHRTEVRSATGVGKPSTSYAFEPVRGG